MKELKLILADGTTVDLMEFVLPMHVVMLCETKEDVLSLWDQLKDENLTEIKIVEGEETLFTILNAGVTSQQSIINTDGTITAHFYLDGERMALADPEYAAAGKILLGEEE